MVGGLQDFSVSPNTVGNNWALELLLGLHGELEAMIQPLIVMFPTGASRLRILQVSAQP